jgi:hypothetical protein
MFDIFNKLKNLVIYRDLSGSSLFRFFVIALILIYGFSQLTEYETLKPVITDLTSKLLSENQTRGDINQQILGSTGQQLVNSINQQCKSQDTFAMPIPMGYETLTIDCKEIRGKGNSGLAQFVSDKMTKDYYKHYECSPIGCMINMVIYRRPGEASYFFSGEMNTFMKKLIPFLLVGTLISLAMIIYSLKKIFPIIKEVGRILFGIAGVPFLILMFIIYRESILVSTGILSGKEEFMISINNFFSGPIYLIVTIFAYLLGIAFILGSVLSIITYINEERLSKSSS